MDYVEAYELVLNVKALKGDGPLVSRFLKIRLPKSFLGFNLSYSFDALLSIKAICGLWVLMHYTTFNVISEKLFSQNVEPEIYSFIMALRSGDSNLLKKVSKLLNSSAGQVSIQSLGINCEHFPDIFCNVIKTV